MNTIQRNAWLKYEADAWFQRNIKVVETYNFDADPVKEILENYVPNFSNVLELGCSLGHRLNGIKTIYPSANIHGVEPSEKAIEFGQATFSKINFHKGTGDNLSIFKDETFDVVIAGFMLYVVDRSLLMRTISEMDRVLKNNGVVILIDFFAANTHRNNYAYIEEQSYTYKQPYEDIFLASKLYHILHKASFSHNTLIKNGSNDFYNKISVSALLKDYDASYE
jgi:ubiquinone/menaquinone biosynthesis C-methylase UbiE